MISRDRMNGLNRVRATSFRTARAWWVRDSCRWDRWVRRRAHLSGPAQLSGHGCLFWSFRCLSWSLAACFWAGILAARAGFLRCRSFSPSVFLSSSGISCRARFLRSVSIASLCSVDVLLRLCRWRFVSFSCAALALSAACMDFSCFSPRRAFELPVPGTHPHRAGLESQPVSTVLD